MKKTKKRILGFFGLVVVASTTAIAMTLPSPEASAVTTSVVDNIEVRVIGDEPRVSISGIESGEVTTDATHDISVSYESVEYITVEIEYVDKDGVTHSEKLIDDEFVDYYPGTRDFSFNFLEDGFTYGDYVMKITGTSEKGTRTDAVRFSFYPVTATNGVDENTGQPYIDLDYNTDDGTTSGTGEVAKIDLDVFGPGPDFNSIPELSQTVYPPTTRVEIPFGKYNLPAGTYKVEITAYNEAGEMLYKRVVEFVIYSPETDTKVPNTGGILSNPNISQSDYLITGIGAFTIIGIVGALYINKKNKNTSKRRR